MTFKKMTLKAIRRAAAVSAVCACAGLGALGAAPASATPLYPDLKMQSPFDLHLWVMDVNGVPHHFLMFGTNLANVGKGPFELDRIPTASGIADLVQRIYDSTGGFHDEHVGSSVFGGSTTFTFPAPETGKFELWTDRGYRRAAARHFKRGRPLYSTDGPEYCVIDYEQVDSSGGALGPRYVNCSNPLTIGISAGWLHRRSWFDDGQWFDFGTQPLPDGDYVLRVIADPNNRYFESPGKADPARESQIANSGVTYLRVIAGQLAGVDPLG
jgi:hypothetical protein